MSNAFTIQEEEKYAEVSKLLSARLHEARAKTGVLRCPFCSLVFDATHCIKCPGCRTLISETFLAATLAAAPYVPPTPEVQAVKKPVAAPKPLLILEPVPATPKKPRRKRFFQPRKIFEKIEQELDFFTQGYMQYP